MQPGYIVHIDGRAADRQPALSSTVCQYDTTKLYGLISPNIARYGLSAHVIAELGDSTEAYAEFNYLQDDDSYTGGAGGDPRYNAVAHNAPTGIYYPSFSSSTFGSPTHSANSLVLYLPVYVCPERVNCATAADKTLNPNNPFAGTGNVARIIGSDWQEEASNSTEDRSFRTAFGINGPLPFLKDATYVIDGTAMHTEPRPPRGRVHVHSAYVGCDRGRDVQLRQPVGDTESGPQLPLSGRPYGCDLGPDAVACDCRSSVVHSPRRYA